MIKIKLVRQRKECDCSIACIATITGIKYEDVIKHFNNNFDKTGLTLAETCQFITENGFDGIQKTNKTYTNIKINNKRMLFPFADIHYIEAKQFSNSKNHHALVMLRNGKVFEPFTGKFINILEEFYEIVNVVGFWKEK